MDEALATNPDVAFITNITAKHMDVALKCANAGCDIFLEKPVSNTFDGVMELDRIAKEKNLVVFMGYQNRYHPCIKKLRKYLDNNSIGCLVTVEAAFCERLITMHTYEDYSTTYMARKEMGGGPLLNLQIHDIDLLQWLFGMPVEGSLNILKDTNSSLKIDVEDNALITYKTIYKGSPLSVVSKSDFLCYPPVHTFRIIGDKGRIDIDMNNAIITKYDMDGQEEETIFSDFQRNDMFIEELQDFSKCINYGSKAAIPLSEGIEGLMIALGLA